MPDNPSSILLWFAQHSGMYNSAANVAVCTSSLHHGWSSSHGFCSKDDPLEFPFPLFKSSECTGSSTLAELPYRHHHQHHHQHHRQQQNQQQDASIQTDANGLELPGLLCPFCGPSIMDASWFRLIFLLCAWVSVAVALYGLLLMDLSSAHAPLSMATGTHPSLNLILPQGCSMHWILQMNLNWESYLICRDSRICFVYSPPTHPTQQRSFSIFP